MAVLRHLINLDAPSTVREKCSISRSRSIAGFVTTATLSLMKSAIFRLSVSSAASGESCPSERIGSTPLLPSVQGVEYVLGSIRKRRIVSFQLEQNHIALGFFVSGIDKFKW